MEHAHLGASNSNIWLNCFPAGRLMRTKKQDQKPSFAAAQGTVAHGLAETAIVFGMDEVREMLGQTTHLDGFDVTVDEEMIKGVERYASYIEMISEPGDTRLVEMRVSLDQVIYGGTASIEPIFGTSDCIIISADGTHVTVIDFKYGAGVAVSASTSQGKFYAVGAIYNHAPNAQSITVVIVQPRAQHDDGPIRSATYSREEIDNFVVQMRDAVSNIHNGHGDFTPGDHCKWCPLMATCPAHKETTQEVVRLNFADKPAAPIAPALLNENELAHILNHSAVIRKWLDAVDTEAQERMEEDGVIIPGWKLVPKRAMRKWADNGQALYDRIAAEIGTVLADSISGKAVLSPAQAQEKLHADDYDMLLKAGLVTSASSGLTLAPEAKQVKAK